MLFPALSRKQVPSGAFEVNPNHRLARGLYALFLPGVTGPFNLAPGGIMGTAPRSPVFAGMTFEGPSGGELLLSSGTPNASQSQPNGAGSIVWHGLPNNSPPDQSFMLAACNPSINGVYLRVQGVNYFISTPGGNYTFGSTAGAKQTIGANMVQNQALTGYQDGVLQGSGSVSSYAIPSDATFYVGSGSSGIGLAMIAAFYTRALGDDEHAQWHAEPFGLFQRPRARRYYVPGMPASGAVSIRLSLLMGAAG